MKGSKQMSAWNSLCFSGLAVLASASLFVSSVQARPQIEKSIKSAIVLADSDDEKISVIVEADSSAEARGLLGEHAELDLRLINAASGSVPVGKLRELAGHGQVRAIYANKRVELIAPVSEDEASPQNGIHMPTVQAVLSQEEANAGMTYGLRLIQAAPAVEFVRKFRKMFESKTGQSLPEIRIGIVDTGIDGHHPNFGKGFIYDWSDLSYDFSPEPRDDNGHGTHVAGTIAGGKTPDGIQFGIIPQDMTRIAVARGLNPYGTDAWLISSLAWMVDPDNDPRTDDGVHVINNSWGSGRRGNLYNRIVKGLTQMGVLCVFAAGNSGPNPGTIGAPAHLPEVLTVGAVDHNKRVTSFSSRGDQIVNSSEIVVKPDVCAPGNAVLSIGPNNTFQRWPGTSMASPHVTAVAALVRMVNPTLKPREIKLLLEETAEDLGRVGKDEEYGSGLVNAFAAVQRAAQLMMQQKGIEPESKAELLAQAKEFMKVRKTQYAVENLMKVINAFPEISLEERIEAGYLMGEAFRELGNFKGAVESYKGVILFDKEGPYVAKALYWINWCYSHAKGENAVPHQRVAVQKWQEWIQAFQAHDWMPLAGMELAKTLLALHQPGEAKQVLAAVLKMRPNTEQRLNIEQLLGEIPDDNSSTIEF